MGDTLITVLVSILVFGFLIFIHEFGHFITAKMFKVTVTEFSIGMGPKLMWYDSKKSGTRYSLAMLPIGGFVAMVGEDGESDDPNAFNKKPAWQRLIITVAGAFMNIVFGFLAMLIIVGFTNIGGTTIAKFETNEEMIARDETIDLTYRSTDKLKVGDTIISVEGNSVYIADELSYQIMRYGNEPVDLVVIRDGVTVEIPDVRFPTMTGQGQIFGMCDFNIYRIEKNLGNFFPISFAKCGLILRMCWESIFDLISGRYTVDAVSGPVGISSAIGEAFQAGALLNMVVIISINLGFMNLLPIPALDGGRILFILIELVSRKKLPTKVETVINMVGLILLLGLSLIIMVKDIFTLF